METQRASTRLREAFRYPYNAGGAQDPDAMDEEEQEQLIHELRKRNDESNDIWLRCLLVLTGLCFVVFVPLLVQATTKQVKFTCILGLTSAAMTGYVLLFVPSGRHRSAIYPRRDLSPAQRFVPYMNGVLSLLIAVSGFAWSGRLEAPEGFFVASWVPLVVFAIVVIARRILVEVDPDELWDLKYELKGA